MDHKKYIHVVTKQSTFKIDSQAEIDQEGSLIKFYLDGNILLVVRTEDFLFCDSIEESK